MKTLVKEHEAPQFEVILNKESNKKFFVASGAIPGTPSSNSSRASVHVMSWDMGW